VNGLLALAPFIDLGRESVFALMAVFCRVGAAVALLPGFGEIALPARVKLAAAVSFTMIVWPAAAPMATLGDGDMTRVTATFACEAVAGVLIGLSVRLLLMALQTAGTIAGQSTSLSQIFGGGVTPDMQPAFANLLTLAGVALAFTLGLPAYAAAALIGSYDVVPFGTLPGASDLAEWGVDRVAGAFAVAAALSAPFVVVSFAYNVALGAINRAMPQLMVAMVGAPAITGGAILLMMLAAPTMMTVWADLLLKVMSDPLTARP
jgi:flagellar biosynthetic protein FliR